MSPVTLNSRLSRELPNKQLGVKLNSIVLCVFSPVSWGGGCFRTDSKVMDFCGKCYSSSFNIILTDINRSYKLCIPTREFCPAIQYKSLLPVHNPLKWWDMMIEGRYYSIWSRMNGYCYKRYVTVNINGMQMYLYEWLYEWVNIQCSI